MEVTREIEQINELDSKALAKSKPDKATEVPAVPFNAYDPPISRKLMERITGLSTPTIMRYEQDGTIVPRRFKHGGQELISYTIKDVQAVLKKRGSNFKRREKAEVIAIFSQKGGVGKSSYTQQLGAMLSVVGKVLVIDLDSQADATSLFAVNIKHSVVESDELEPSIMELIDWTMSDNSDPGIVRMDFEQVVKEVSPTLHVIPADLDLSEVNYNLNRLPIADRVGPDGNPAPGALYVIKEVVEQIQDRYDFILFDLPPNIEVCNVAALFAANRIIVPLELEAKCLKTMSRNEEFLDRLRSSHPGFNWDKVLVVPNKFMHQNIKIKALARIQDIYSGREDITLSQAIVPHSTIIDRCAESKEPVFVAATKHGKEFKTAIPAAKEFTDIFWVVMHEILDLEPDRLIFANVEESGNA